jgi:uncharacterized GH25 family protein
VRRAAFALAALLPASAALAHDFWIQPSTFHPRQGEEVSFALRVGQDFKGDPVPRDDRRILGFALVTARGAKAIPGLPATDPAGEARVEEPGWTVVAYRSSRSPVKLEPAKFEQYLADEGLDRVLALRRQRGESDRPGNEVFSRCAKALLSVSPSASGFERVIGLTLELVPETSPAASEARRSFRVRLLYEGRPLEGALVVAIPQAQPDRKIRARTGRDGRASLPLTAGGVWLVKAVHMIPAPAETGADWESLWASLTFEIP